MAKLCKFCKINPVWGGGFCQRHQYLRTDKKPKQKYFVKKARNHSSRLDFGFEGQQDLFAWLWEDAKDRNGIVTCPYTGMRLNSFYGTDMWWSCFAHVLPKGRYTYWKLNPVNVKVVSPFFHKIIDSGTSLDRINHPDWLFSEWDNEVERLKIQYNLFKRMNMLA